MKNENTFEYFQIKPISRFGVTMQICILTGLYVLMTLGYYFQVKSTGKMDGYAPSTTLLFVPIYEELIFRGFLLKIFEKFYRSFFAVLAVSVLFALWHLKNIFWLDQNQLVIQMLYTGLFFSPVTCWLTIKTRSVWPAIMFHFLNNFPFESWAIFLRGHL